MRTPAATLPETDFLALRYRPDLHLLVGRWQRPVSAAEFRQGYRAMLRAARQTDCPFWQLDLRGRNAPDEAARHWLQAEFLPQLAGRLRGPVCLAYLLPPSMLQQLGPLLEGPACVAFFSEEGPLTSWPTQCQHRSRAALVAAGFTPPPAA